MSNKSKAWNHEGAKSLNFLVERAKGHTHHTPHDEGSPDPRNLQPWRSSDVDGWLSHPLITAIQDTGRQLASLLIHSHPRGLYSSYGLRKTCSNRPVALNMKPHQNRSPRAFTQSFQGYRKLNSMFAPQTAGSSTKVGPLRAQRSTPSDRPSTGASSPKTLRSSAFA